MGKANIIHAHDIVHDRVMAAIDTAADEIADLFVNQCGADREDVRKEVHAIIVEHAYYGDRVKHGEISADDREKIDVITLARHPELASL